MNKQLLFNFKKDISNIDIPQKLNNPFGDFIPELARVAAKEFQEFIAKESKNWKYDFEQQKGKMFGVLVVQNEDKAYGYLGTISGKIPGDFNCDKFTPSILDASAGELFLDKGMNSLTEIGHQIKNSKNKVEQQQLTAQRKQKSQALQQLLFENYRILNNLGTKQNVLEIFLQSSHGNPPAAAGECAAPKLLQTAFNNHLKPVALAEFWWGESTLNIEKKHKAFYPACKNKCRPILEYMLGDRELYNSSKKVIAGE